MVNTFRDVHHPETSKLLFRYDAQRSLIEIQRRGIKYLVDLLQFKEPAVGVEQNPPVYGVGEVEVPSSVKLRHKAPKQEPRLVGMSTEEMVALMEERWRSLGIERCVRKAQVAVGLRFSVFQRDGLRCRYCGRSAADGVMLEADHIVPRSKGGLDEMDNLVTACMDCNRGKSDKNIGNLLQGIRSAEDGKT